MTDASVLGFFLVLVFFLLYMWLSTWLQVNTLNTQLRTCEMELNLYQNLYYIEKNANQQLLSIGR